MPARRIGDAQHRQRVAELVPEPADGPLLRERVDPVVRLARALEGVDVLHHAVFLVVRLLDEEGVVLDGFLTRDGGVNSGFMMAQVTAAAVASELKALAHPAGVDTIPTSANKEDHVSMSMSAALKAQRAVTRAREVIAIEILCACQAIDFLAPLTTSPTLARVHALVRSRVPALDADRAPSPDIATIPELIASRAFEDACGGLVK